MPNEGGSDSEESGYFLPPPKAPEKRKRLDPQLRVSIHQLLSEIMLDFDEMFG
jgi:hypothetical protein